MITRRNLIKGLKTASFATGLSALAAGEQPRAGKAVPYAPPLTAVRRKMEDALACAGPGNGESQVGIFARQLSTGRTLYERDAFQSFIPASNAKLYSMAFALSKLGPDNKFETRIGASQPPDRNGNLSGDLVLVGGGDPSFCARRNLGLEENPMQAMEWMADQVVAAGVRVVDGDIVGDDTHFEKDLYPIGWTLEDATWSYGSPVSALTVFENQLDVRVEAVADEEIPRVSVSPLPGYFVIENRLRTGARTNWSIDRQPGSRQLVLSGTIAAGTKRSEQAAIDDPPEFAAAILKDALERRGVRITGGIRSRSREAEDLTAAAPIPVIFAAHQSAPLVDLLRVVGKTSRNLYAEMTLRQAGLVASGGAGRQAAVRNMMLFLSQAGTDTKCCFFQDGSGLSRQTLVTPVSTVDLLGHMYAMPLREHWMSLLPVGARDGTLTFRMRGSPLAGRVRAKTGAIAHVATVSGYANSRTWGEVAFSAMVNNFTGDSGDVWRMLDKICLALAE